MGHQMTRIFSRYPLSLVLLGASAFAGGVLPNSIAQAGQSINSADPYYSVDPFDPSEVVSHALKDDIRLRLRLPAPDLPPSIVASAPTQNTTVEKTDNAKPSAAASSPQVINANQPGLIGKSIQAVMSIFDWSDDTNNKAPKSDFRNSDGPIRINIHVGITKPAKESPNTTKVEEVSSLVNPWSRNQDRVRRLFTVGEIKTHN